MYRSENKIEPIPMALDPSQAGGGTSRIVIQFDSSEDLNIRKLCAQGFKYVEVNARQIPVVVRECNTSDSPCPATFNPGAQQLKCVGADHMALRVSVVITNRIHINCRLAPGKTAQLTRRLPGDVTI